MVLYAKIRWIFFRELLSISEIQRRTSVSRKTIKQWLKAPDGAQPNLLRAKAIGKLTAFEPKLLLALEVDAHHAKRDRRSVLNNVYRKLPIRYSASHKALHFKLEPAKIF